MFPFFKNKRVVVNNGNIHYKFIAQNQMVSQIALDDYKCEYEEADTRMFYIVSKLQTPKNILVRCNDTDVLVIFLGNFHKVRESNIWLEVGLFGKNNLRYVHVNELYDSLGEDLGRVQNS